MYNNILCERWQTRIVDEHFISLWHGPLFTAWGRRDPQSVSLIMYLSFSEWKFNLCPYFRMGESANLQKSVCCYNLFLKTVTQNVALNLPHGICSSWSYSEVACVAFLRYLINEGFWDIKTHRWNLKPKCHVHWPTHFAVKKRFSVVASLRHTR